MMFSETKEKKRKFNIQAETTAAILATELTVVFVNDKCPMLPPSDYWQREMYMKVAYEI